MKPKPGEKPGSILVFRSSETNSDSNSREKKLVKIERADGGNLGTQRRRRTWRPTKSSGEREASNEPEVSEWGNPETQC